MKTFLLVSLVISGFLSSQFAFARGYGDAGCGLGSIIMQRWQPGSGCHQ